MDETDPESGVWLRSWRGAIKAPDHYHRKSTLGEYR